MSKYGGTYLKEGDNTAYMLYLADIMAMPKIDLKKCTPEELNEHTQEYLRISSEHDQKIGLSNFALSLKLTREQLKKFLERRFYIADDVYEVLMLVNAMLGTALEDGMISGSSNVVGSIFIGKNNFNYKDQSEQVVVHEDRRLSAEELKQIADSLPDVIDGEFTVVKEPEKIGETNNGEEEK